MDKATLEGLVARRLTARQIAEETGRTPSTVRYWLRRHGLKTVRARRDDELASKYVTSTCHRHGEARFVLEGRGPYRCTRCTAERVAERRRRAKAELVAEAGGSCAICGYNRCIGALSFHHLNRLDKSSMLLCANCHAEVEAGLISATLFRRFDERGAA